MLAFERAIEIGLQSVELDLWMTKDRRIIIIHGGDNGEMPAPVERDINYQTEHIFDLKYDEICQKFKKTHYWLDSPQTDKCMIPQLFQLFNLVNTK